MQPSYFLAPEMQAIGPSLIASDTKVTAAAYWFGSPLQTFANIFYTIRRDVFAVLSPPSPYPFRFLYLSADIFRCLHEESGGEGCFTSAATAKLLSELRLRDESQISLLIPEPRRRNDSQLDIQRRLCSWQEGCHRLFETNLKSQSFGCCFMLLERHW